MVAKKPDNVTTMLAPLIEQVRMNEVTADRCIIFCQTYKDTALVFQTQVLDSPSDRASSKHGPLFPPQPNALYDTC